jgi:hypothetical protein
VEPTVNVVNNTKLIRMKKTTVLALKKNHQQRIYVKCYQKAFEINEQESKLPTPDILPNEK